MKKLIKIIFHVKKYISTKLANPIRKNSGSKTGKTIY